MTTEILSISAQHAKNVAPAAPAPTRESGNASAQPAPAAAVATPRPDEQSRANIRAAVDRINRQMQDSSRDLNFSIDEGSDRVVITVKRATTGEVIRQIPDQALLRVAHNIEDIKGLLHNATT